MSNEQLVGSLDYKTWFDQLQLNISGLVPNARATSGDETRVNHSWRFVRRSEACSKPVPAFLYSFQSFPVLSSGHLTLK